MGWVQEESYFTKIVKPKGLKNAPIPLFFGTGATQSLKRG